jgi:hypothetical protein
MKFKHIKLVGECISLSDDAVNFLGPELTLQDCIVNSDCSGRAISESGVRMYGGCFSQLRPLHNHAFERAHFNGVKFSGAFVGCDFGNWDSLEIGSIENCDFSEALLDGCRFLRCNPETIIFPQWPYFTILNPSNARDFVLSQNWPKKFLIKLDIYTDVDPECVACVGDAIRLSKDCQLELSEMKKLLMSVPSIFKVN